MVTSEVEVACSEILRRQWVVHWLIQGLTFFLLFFHMGLLMFVHIHWLELLVAFLWLLSSIAGAYYDDQILKLAKSLYDRDPIGCDELHRWAGTRVAWALADYLGAFIPASVFALCVSLWDLFWR